MKVLVCGSRNWTDRLAVYGRLLQLSKGQRSLEVVHGAARGADMMAHDAATLLGVHVTAYPADWQAHGKRAGILRNLEMLDTHPDLVIAFQRDSSRGTQHTIDEAHRRGIRVEVHTA